MSSSFWSIRGPIWLQAAKWGRETNYESIIFAHNHLNSFYGPTLQLQQFTSVRLVIGWVCTLNHLKQLVNFLLKNKDIRRRITDQTAQLRRELLTSTNFNTVPRWEHLWYWITAVNQIVAHSYDCNFTYTFVCKRQKLNIETALPHRCRQALALVQSSRPGCLHWTVQSFSQFSLGTKEHYRLAYGLDLRMNLTHIGRSFYFVIYMF